MRNSPPGRLKKEARRAALLKKLRRTAILSAVLSVFFMLTMGVAAHAEDFSVTVSPGEAGEMGALEVIVIFAFLALLPSLFLMLTSFTRIVIVMGFVRNALGTGQSPPNMVLIGISLVLTLFIMMPVLTEMNTVAFQPYQDGGMTFQEAIDAAQRPIKRFMLDETEDKALSLFLTISDTVIPEEGFSDEDLQELPLTVIAPAFITSELSRAFMMGFMIFLPFLVVDMVVSSILMSMGMVMLPPAMIALPFKILLFVMVDGWYLLVSTLANSFS